MRVNLNNLNYGIKCSVKILRFVKIYATYFFNIFIYFTKSIFKNKEKNIYEILHIIRHVRVRATRIIN